MCRKLIFEMNRQQLFYQAQKLIYWNRCVWQSSSCFTFDVLTKKSKCIMHSKSNAFCFCQNNDEHEISGPDQVKQAGRTISLTTEHLADYHNMVQKAVCRNYELF